MGYGVKIFGPRHLITSPDHLVNYGMQPKMLVLFQLVKLAANENWNGGIPWARLPAALHERSPRSSPELTAGLVDLELLISTNMKSACLNRAGCIN